jgi:hypothetical protein
MNALRTACQTMGPALIAFGPLLMVIGLGMGGDPIHAVIGALTIAGGALLLQGKIDRFEKKVEELSRR